VRAGYPAPVSAALFFRKKLAGRSSPDSDIGYRAIGDIAYYSENGCESLGIYAGQNQTRCHASMSPSNTNLQSSRRDRSPVTSPIR
jgi:hypothetical protein